jgi:hypothetical protein
MVTFKVILTFTSALTIYPWMDMMSFLLVRYGKPWMSYDYKNERCCVTLSLYNVHLWIYYVDASLYEVNWTIYEVNVSFYDVDQLSYDVHLWIYDVVQSLYTVNLSI